MDDFEWDLAIAINKRALINVVATLFTLVGLVESGPVVKTVSRGVRRMVLIALQPAESALRRLIYVRAKDMPLDYPAPKAAPKDEGVEGKDKARRQTRNKDEKRVNGCGDEQIAPFSLFDRRKDFEGNRRRAAWGRKPKFGPQIRGFDEPTPPPEPVPPVPTDEDLLDAGNLIGRLRSLHRALNDISGEAHRMMRAMGRRERRGMGLKGPIRPLYAPGHRKRHRHAVDEILDELQTLGRWVEKIRWQNSS